MKNGKETRFMSAKRRVARIKGFYKHLMVYLISNIILLLGKTTIIGFVLSKGVEDPNFFLWLEWNIIMTPVLWGIVLLVHGIYVFRFQSVSLKELKPKALREWERRQIEKYME